MENGEKYRLFVERASEGIVLIHERKIVYINPRALKGIGYSKKEVINHNFDEFVHPDDKEMVLKYYLQKSKGHEITTVFFRVIDKGGSIKWVESRSSVLTYEGRPALLASFIDITERKRMEEALLESERQKESILDSLVEHVIHEDKDMRIQWPNRAACESVGMSREGLIGRHCYEIWPQRNDPCPDCPVIYAMKTDRIQEIEKSTPDGRSWYIRGYPVHDANGEIVGGIEVTLETTERKHAEEALAISEERYRSLFERLPVGVYRSTPDGRFLEANPAFMRLLGCPNLEILLNTPVNYFYRNPKEREQWKKLIEQEGKSFATEMQWQKLDGTPLWVRESARAVSDKNGRVLYYDGVAEDITELKRVENEQKEVDARLQNAQRMEAIGTLAGGIAHDFNNILTAIMGYAEIAMYQESPEDSSACQSLEQVLVAGERAKDLVKQILVFSRQTDEQRRPLLLTPIVKEVIKLMRATLPSTIEVRQSIAPNVGSVIADPTQIHQVLMNLCTNAYHAMRDKGGVLNVKLEDIELSPDDTAKHLDIHPGPYIKLTVSDTGHGIEKNNIDRIFDPYFTTKAKGEGTGMGLAVVHGIVKDHGGSITVFSNPGKKTTFSVFLPKIKVAAAREKLGQITPISKGKERILFVDDESAIVDIGKKMLERLGYDVEGRTSPIEALKAFQADPNKFDLVISDMTMPKMAGNDLARELMAIRPDIPIILCTGFSERMTEDKAKEMGIKAFAMKPIVIREMAQSIRRALDD